MHLLFCILFHYGLSQDIEYSSLCYIVGPCLCIHFMYNSLHLLIPTSHFIPPLTPSPPWQLQVCSLCKDPWTFKAGTKLGALTHLFTLFYRQGEPAGTLPQLFWESVVWDPKSLFQETGSLSELLAPRLPSHWSCHPRQTLRAGRAGGKYVGLRDFNLIFFSSLWKELKSSRSLLQADWGYFGKLQLTVLYFSFPFCPCCPHRSGKLLNLSPSPQPRGVCPSLFLLCLHALGKKREFNSY